MLEVLIYLVEDNHLLGAGLDAVDPEPLPAERRIWDVENIIITPHISGGYHLLETLEKIVEISAESAENLRSYTSDKKIMNIVDFNTGYRILSNR
ncbi:NAD(P)-dependent oxidoreductase [Clostridium sp. BL-8]|uniref:NAD(P)-dependent oxidoreductase n=1 Tax=Clostridium sp. BL-8 TaxID=349938 RepID=UPI0009D14C50|nr:NAD(P)-dependent oxidoreductase [Clostridium sp. BL-8]OOM80852.1 glyoxylate/hydroxypyruvate reductase A [Clostridium sp. BL-8]